MGESWEWDDIPDVLHTEDELKITLKSESKSSVRNGSKASQIKIPVENDRKTKNIFVNHYIELTMRHRILNELVSQQGFLILGF